MSWNPNQQQQQQQQQYSYQPPASAARRGGATDPTTFGMDAKNEALVSYFLWWLTGIFFFLFERKNRFVRFHAAQSTVLFGIVTILLLIFKVVGLIWLIGPLLSPLLGCATTIVLIAAGLLWLFLMLMAYRGSAIHLPIIGEYAEKMVEKTTRKRRVK